MNFSEECLYLGGGEYCMRGAVSSGLQQRYDAALQSGSVEPLKRVRAEIRQAAPGAPFGPSPYRPPMP